MLRSRIPLPALLAGLLLLLAPGGCDTEDVTRLEVPATTATFDVTVRVLSHPERTPVPGADFSLVLGDQAGLADGDGNFRLEELLPGSYQLLVAAPGFSGSRVTLRLDAGTGAKASYQTHRDAYLLPNTASLRTTLYDQETGQVLAGVPVTVAGVAFPGEILDHQVDWLPADHVAVTDGQGAAVFAGLPCGRVTVAVDALDRDGDGLPDLAGTTATLPLSATLPTAHNLTLPPFSGQEPEILATNLPGSYDSLVAPALYFIFSQPMQQQGQVATALLRQDNSPYAEVPLRLTWASPLRLEITPLQALDDATMDYDFSLAAWNLDGAHLGLTVYSLFWMTGTGGGDCTDVVTDATARALSGTVDYDTRDLLLTWSAVPCAGGYRIFARDDRDNPDWLYLATEPMDYETGTVSTSVQLPASFDRYQVDGLQTPFAGTTVELTVVPLQAEQPQPDAVHPVLTLADVTPPTLLSCRQLGTALNETGVEQLMEYQVVFSEYVSAEAPDPGVEIEEAGGDPDFVLLPADLDWVWGPGRRQGSFIGRLAPGQNAAGDRLRVTLADLGDLSGNLIAGPVATAWDTLTAWGGRFDFENSPQGWTQEGPGWEWGTPLIGPAAAHLSVRCWGVTLTSYHENNWVTSLYSPYLYVPEGTALLTFWCWYDTDYYDDFVYLYLERSASKPLLAQYHGASNGWIQRTFNLSAYAGERIRLEYRFVSDEVDVMPGFFLDDVVLDVD